MTGAETLDILNRLRALYVRQAEIIAATDPKLEDAIALSSEIHVLMQALPPPDQVTDATAAVLAELGKEAAAVEDLRKASVTALTRLRNRFAAGQVSLQRSTDLFKAYGQPKPDEPAKFLDKKL